MEEARAMAQDAIRAYIESQQKEHLPAIADKPPDKEVIRVLVPEPA